MGLARSIRQPGGVLGFGILAVAAATALFAPWMSPYSPIQQFPDQQLVPPSATFLFGTDTIGRDVFSRTIFGTQTAFLVGVVAVVLGAGVGTFAGLLSGYSRGAIDAIIMRTCDGVLAVPAVLLGMCFAAALGPSAVTVAMTLSIASMPTFARLTRGTVLVERSKEYVLAARLIGGSSQHIIFRHMLPNVAGPILVQIALTMSVAVLLEAGLSFLGLGVQPPQPSWGGMLAYSRQFLTRAPWYGIFPGLALTLLVLGLNALADAVRDALDPRLI
jgi:peptide/nickel transport system permease protein